MTDWVKRDYDRRTDEDAVVYLWLKSYAHARHNVLAGAHRDAGKKDEQHPERIYWRRHAPIVEKLLRYGTTEVLCDPERVDGSNGPPGILAFACTNGDVVHYVCVKRDYARAGFGPEMVRDLLGSRLTRACMYTHELVEMREHQKLPPPCGVAVPSMWRHDPWWLARQLLGGARKGGVSAMAEYFTMPPKGSILALPQEDGSWRFRVNGCACAPGCFRAYHDSLAEAEQCSERVMALAKVADEH